MKNKVDLEKCGEMTEADVPGRQKEYILKLELSGSCLIM